MGKKLSDRTHKVQVDRARAGMSQQERRAATNARSHARNEARRAQLRAEAEARLAEWNKLSPWEKLRRLDDRLGKGIGAKKSRARYLKQIEELEKKAQEKKAAERKAQEKKGGKNDDKRGERDS